MSKKLIMAKFAQSVSLNNSEYNHISPGVADKIGATLEIDDGGVTITENTGNVVRVFAANICYIKYAQEAKAESKSKK